MKRLSCPCKSLTYLQTRSDLLPLVEASRHNSGIFYFCLMTQLQCPFLLKTAIASICFFHHVESHLTHTPAHVPQNKYFYLCNSINAYIPFHQYLFRREFTIMTDHKLLTHLFHPKKSIPQMACARLQRWALTLGTYS